MFDLLATANRRRKPRRRLFVFATLAAALVSSDCGLGASAGPADSPSGVVLGLPVNCRLGDECFVQQMPDMDPGPGMLSVERQLSNSPTAIMDFGLAKAPPELPNLVREGGPPLVKLSEPIIAWVWAINVERGSFFRIRLLDPERVPILDIQTGALEGRKANYLVYIGGKHSARAGGHDLKVELFAGTRTSNRQPNRLN